MAVVGGGPTTVAAIAQPSVQVFVGYADTSRSNPANFPSPWADPSNHELTFYGCKPANECGYDAGAVRLVNNSSSPITIGSVKIEYSAACVYDIWPDDVMLAPGGQLIVTQLNGGGGAGCTNTTDPSAPGYGEMDSSDIGPFPGGDVCAPSGVIPRIDVVVNGNPTTFADTGQVLNTGGVDRAHCPPGGTAVNESIQWTSVGSLPCGGAVLSLSPAGQGDARGGIATLTASLRNGCGEPLQGSRVSFRVFGPNAPDAGQSGFASTGADGTAVFSYPETSTELGTDRVQASISGPGGTLLSGVVTVNWINEPRPGPYAMLTELSLSPLSFEAGPNSGASIVFTKQSFGTIVSYRVSQASITTFTVFRLVHGRRQLLGTFLKLDLKGEHRFRFTGRVNRKGLTPSFTGRPLIPGRYLMLVVTHNSGGAGPGRRQTFVVARQP